MDIVLSNMGFTSEGALRSTAVPQRTARFYPKPRARLFGMECVDFGI
jgi:hypothetical protein